MSKPNLPPPKDTKLRAPLYVGLRRVSDGWVLSKYRPGEPEEDVTEVEDLRVVLARVVRQFEELVR